MKVDVFKYDVGTVISRPHGAIVIECLVSDRGQGRGYWFLTAGGFVATGERQIDNLVVQEGVSVSQFPHCPC